MGPAQPRWTLSGRCQERASRGRIRVSSSWRLSPSQTQVVGVVDLLTIVPLVLERPERPLSDITLAGRADVGADVAQFGRAASR